MGFPTERPRRLRRTEAIRSLVRETDLAPRHLIAPMFAKEGIIEPDPIVSMPPHAQHTLASLAKEARETLNLGVRTFLVFGIPERKDAVGSQAYHPDGISQRAIAALRDELGADAVIVGDLCLCEYTDHGHCGVLQSTADQAAHQTGSADKAAHQTGSADKAAHQTGSVDNDATLELYARTAVAQAEAGADLVAPSGMMDGQVAHIRAALDDAGHTGVGIMAYAAKYASAHYGPFREAAECAPQEGDRSGYQMDPANIREALREAALDEAEGADVVMVKPALPYLDVIRALAERSLVPVAAYNVSGEYAMVQAAAERGWLDGERIALEHLTAIRRAGADMVITYFAKAVAAKL